MNKPWIKIGKKVLNGNYIVGFYLKEDNVFLRINGSTEIDFKITSTTLTLNEIKQNLLIYFENTASLNFYDLENMP